jgi:hypothetical protein
LIHEDFEGSDAFFYTAMVRKSYAKCNEMRMVLRAVSFTIL